MHLFWVLHKMEKKRKSHLIQGRLLFSLAHLASDTMTFPPQNDICFHDINGLYHVFRYSSGSQQLDVHLG
jgi:hypothetical protein